MQTNILFYLAIATSGLINAMNDDTRSEVSAFSLDRHMDQQSESKPTGIIGRALAPKGITGGPKIPIQAISEQPTSEPTTPATPARSINLGGSASDAKPVEPKSPKIKVEIEGIDVKEVAGAIDGAKVGCCGAKVK